MDALATFAAVAQPVVGPLPLPWRVRQFIDASREGWLRERTDAEVLNTRPMQTGVDAPHFEIHMMLGHRHVGMTLWAVKSFLHQCGRRYAVHLHEDGSLTEQDVAVLLGHLPGVTVVRKTDADERAHELLHDRPNCYGYRFANRIHSDHRNTQYNMHIFAVRLFDFNLFSVAEKRMFLDADVLFFKPPHEIIDWIENRDDRRSMYSVEAFEPHRDSRGRYVFKPKERTFNAGLICLSTHMYDLDVIEEWIGANQARMNRAPTFEQAAYEHCIRRFPESIGLPDTYPFNNTTDQSVATHFGVKRLFFENIPRVAPNLRA